MLTLSLVWTPDRHRQLHDSGPELKPFESLASRQLDYRCTPPHPAKMNGGGPLQITRSLFRPPLTNGFADCLEKGQASFDCLARAAVHRLFTSAIPLLLTAGTFACCVSALGLYVPHYRTWCTSHSCVVTMLTLSLVWTPDRHRQLHDSGPELKPFESLASRQLDYRCTPPHPAKMNGGGPLQITRSLFRPPLTNGFADCLEKGQASFDCLARAAVHRLFTSAIPLLLTAGTFACCVSALGLYVPHYRTWCTSHSCVVTMLTLSLVWTPDRHRQLHDSGPELKPFESLASRQLDYRCTPPHPAKMNGGGPLQITRSLFRPPLTNGFADCLEKGQASFDCLARAAVHRLFTSAIPLLLTAGTFACCVSALGLYVPHYRTWCTSHSCVVTMLTLSLVWTPDRHRQLHDSGPELKPFESLASRQLDYRCTPPHPAKMNGGGPLQITRSLFRPPIDKRFCGLPGKRVGFVRLSCAGCRPPSIHKRYPTTAHCGNFCLLRFRPGPVRSSLSNLVYITFLRRNHVDTELSVDA